MSNAERFLNLSQKRRCSLLFMSYLLRKRCIDMDISEQALQQKHPVRASETTVATKIQRMATTLRREQVVYFLVVS